MLGLKAPHCCTAPPLDGATADTQLYLLRMRNDHDSVMCRDIKTPHYVRLIRIETYSVTPLIAIRVLRNLWRAHFLNSTALAGQPLET